MNLQQALIPDPDMPEQIQPLSWLRSMIEDCRTRGPAADDDDPDAYYEMVREVEQLHERIKAALSATNRNTGD